MGNNIFHVVLKHKIYEWCLDIIFRHIVRNFPSKAPHIPQIGEKYVSIQHVNLEETYFNCTVVDPAGLDEYDLLDDTEKQDVKFAISFKRSVYISEGEEIEIYDENDENNDAGDGLQYFVTIDMKHLVFKQ